MTSLAVTWTPTTRTGDVIGSPRRTTTWTVKVTTQTPDSTYLTLTMAYPIAGGAISNSTASGTAASTTSNVATRDLPTTAPDNCTPRLSKYSLFAEPMKDASLLQTRNVNVVVP